jgi:glycosyltransferase involved in cell wall biosynthesis
MRVAVDMRTVYSPRRRGTAKNLIDLYTTLAALKPAWQFLMLHQRDTADDPFALCPNVTRKRIDIAGDRFNLWENVRLPLAARALGADVLHCPANTAPAHALTPLVVTIHDLIPLELAPNHPSTSKWIRRVRRASERAHCIITPSEYTRGLIVDKLGASVAKVTVNPWAPDKACRRVESPAALSSLRRKYGVPDGARYVVAFGAQDPRKNTARIIDAWLRLDSTVRRDARLVIVGLQSEALARCRAQIGDAPDGSSCLLHGFADEEDISALLSGASALCYPSKSEGFGLPVLDAFACGTPVITSTTTSLPEVAGDAALLVDPEDVGAIANALADLLTSAHTGPRLRAAGAARLRLYSWERCARVAAETIESAATAA